MDAKGTFEISMQPEPPYEAADGITLCRMRLDKRFSGSLDATSSVQMLAARTGVENSAGYVALERITGTLDGRNGSFVVVHCGLMNRGAQALTITIVPDSGTEALSGISGGMKIRIADGQHFYELEYAL